MLYYVDPTQTECFINETSSPMKQVSVGTVIPYIRDEVQENVSRFGQNHWKSPYSGLIWGHSTLLQFQNYLKYTAIYIYTNETHWYNHLFY